MTNGIDATYLHGSPRTLAGLVRESREAALLTQEELAERSGLSVRTIRDIESGRILRPRSASVRALADTLDLTDQQRKALIATALGNLPERARFALPHPTTTTSAPEVPAQLRLPAGVAEFTGRAEYLTRLDELLPGGPEAGQGAMVIWTITGMAGVGKTALAVHWAHRVARHFPDGQLFVDLRGRVAGPAVGPERALAQLLHGLGVPAEHVPVEIEAAAGLYRSLLAGKRLLVVLDDARGAEQVRPLMPGSPGCQVLVTSRNRLAGLVATHGARRMAVDVMTPAESATLLARLLGEDRAAAEPEAVAALAQLCGYLPLAMRVVAANLTTLPGALRRHQVSSSSPTDR